MQHDRTLERQRDCNGMLGMFQVCVWPRLCRRRRLTSAWFHFAQVVGVRLFAVSVAKLLLLAAVLSGAHCTAVSLRDLVH